MLTPSKNYAVKTRHPHFTPASETIRDIRSERDPRHPKRFRPGERQKYKKTPNYRRKNQSGRTSGPIPPQDIASPLNSIIILKS